MNKIYFLSFFACATISTYASEHQASEQQAVALPDWQAAHQALCNDYKHYLKNQLEQYKTSPVKMDELASMAHLIKQTGHDNDIFFMKDDQQNGFIHVAIQKEDHAAVNWLYRHGNWPILVACNKARKNALDLCIEKLSPDAEISPEMKVITLMTLNQMACLPGPLGVSLTTLTKGVRGLIALELAYKMQQKKLDGISFDYFYDNATARLCERTQATPLGLLASFYRAAADEQGNTFTHALVELEQADELFKWITQGRVSCAKNKAQLTPLDRALDKFRYYTIHYQVINEPGRASCVNNRRCCLFMLMNYLKRKEGSTDTLFGNCCDKHTIIA